MVTLNLPWGIGEHTIQLEGVDNAQGKRNAVGAYGEYIRGLIKERTDDEAITARAKAAAARSELNDSPNSTGIDTDAGLQDSGREAEAVQAASEAHEEAAEEYADFGATLIARESALLERVGRAKADLARWEQELKGIKAALKAMEVDDG